MSHFTLKHLAKLRIVAAVIFLLSALFAQAQPLPFDTTVTTGKLSNGLTYYIKPNKKPENKLELRLVVNAGSILEDDDQQGLAHFMEHMNFNGTEHYPKNALVDFLQNIGVEFGADLNAYTGFDETVYILPIPTENRENVSKGFEVLSDWAQKALITDQDVNDERKVVLEESRMGKGADDRMMQIYLPKLMAGSRYASRLPIGKDEILKTFPPDVIRRFYHDWYRPDLMAVLVVGDITREEAKSMIEKYFSGLKNPENEKPRPEFEVPAFTKKEAMVLSDKEATNQEFSLVYSSHKKPVLNTVQEYRNSIVQNLFTGMLNTRLQDLTQTATPPFLYSYAYVGGWARGYENFQLAAVASGDMQTAINASIGELVRVQKYGFNAEELEVEKKGTLSYIEKMYNERNTTESGRMIWEYVRHFLEQEGMPGIEKDYEYYKTMLPAITVDEVNAMAREWLGDNKNYFAMITGPADAQSSKIKPKKLLKMVKKAFKQKVSAPEVRIYSNSLLSTEPTPGKILTQEVDADLGTTTFNLSNGLTVTLKTTDFKSDEIILQGTKPGGTNQYGADDKMNVSQLNQIVSVMGYGDFQPTDMEKMLSGKNANMRVNIGGTRCSVSGQSSVKDFETLLQLTYLKLTSPRKDDALFQGYMSRQIASLEYMKANPQTAFIDSMNKVMYNNDPLTPVYLPTPEQLAQVNADRILEMYREHVGAADGFHFFLIGNIDEATARPLIEKYLAGLPVKGMCNLIKDNGLRPVTGDHEFNMHKGTEPKSLILDRYYGDLAYSQDLALKANLMADILNIKVIEELREKIGGIYSGGMYASLVREPREYFNVVLYLPCGPESVDTLLKAASVEFNRIMAEGPSEKDLAKVKIATIEKYREGIKTNGFWAGNLTDVMVYGNDKQRLLHYEDAVNAVTADDIKATAQLMLKGQSHFRAVLWPEEK